MDRNASNTPGGVEARASAVANQAERSSTFVVMGFASIMMLMTLVLPFIYHKKDLGLWTSVLQVLLWAGFCSAWIGQGYLMKKAGVSFDMRNSPSNDEGNMRSRGGDILFYLFVFGPLCFSYIYVTYQNTGYFGFNYVLMFVLAGFSTLVFSLWAAALYLLYQCALWVVLGYLLWGGWMNVVDIVTMFSGLLFSSMMFYIFRRERRSRSRAFALSVELDEANEKLRAFSQQVEELAATQERNRIAREIHDTIGHSLTVVNMQLETAKALMDEDPGKARDFVEKAQDVTKKGLADVRASVASLRESPLDGKSLADALRALLKDAFSDTVAARLELTSGSDKTSPPLEAALYRSAQEAFTNVRKHAEASEVVARLDLSHAEQVTLQIEDNGKGCEKVEGGFGVLGIRERVQLLNGNLEVVTSPGKGLSLVLSIPR